MAKKVIQAQMQQRRDTAANWAASNPVLLEGELGIVTDDPNLYKIGDGVTAWNDLKFRGFDGTLVQTTGDSENAAMSQKAVTSKLTELESEIGNIKGEISTNKGYYVPISLKKGQTYSISISNVTLSNGLTEINLRLADKQKSNSIYISTFKGDSTHTISVPNDFDCGFIFFAPSSNADYTLTYKMAINQQREINTLLEDINDVKNTAKEIETQTKRDIESLQKSTMAARFIQSNESDAFIIVDNKGHVIAKITNKGIESAGIEVKSYNLEKSEIRENGKNDFKVCDEQGNVIFALSDKFVFGDNVKKFIESEYLKPAISWVDDDFQIYDDTKNIAPEYQMTHDWCLEHDIRFDFAYIPSLYIDTPQYAERQQIALQWQKESFHFLLHPDHQGWFDDSENGLVHDLKIARASIVEVISFFRKIGFVTGDNILIYPGHSYTYKGIIPLAKEYVDAAIVATNSETNHGMENERYKLERYTISFSENKPKSKVKKDIARFVANNDWVILETHLYGYRNDLTTIDETTNSLANVLEVVEYANSLCPIRPTSTIWKERKMLFDIYNK